MGVYVGDDEELTPKSWENPAGFFERRDARKICDTLLHRSNADWWKVSGFHADNVNHEAARAQRPAIRELIARLDERGTWALKEPRLCLLLPIFQSSLIDPLAVITLRHPVEIALSLRRRNGFPLEAGLALWEAYTVSLLEVSWGLDRVYVDFHELTRDPGSALSALQRELTLRGIVGLDLRPAVESIQPSLRRERFEQDLNRRTLSAAQAELWRELTGERAWKTPPQLSAAALSILREFEADEAIRLEARASIKNLMAKVAALEKDQAETKAAEQRHAAKAEEAAKRLTELTPEIERLRREAVAEVAPLQRELERLRSAAQAEVQLRENERTEVSALRERFASECRVSEILRGDVATRDSEITALRVAIGLLETHQAENNELLRAERSRLESAQAALAARDAEVLSLRAVLAEAKEHQAGQQQRLDAESQRIEQLSTQLAAREAELHAGRRLAEELRSQLLTLEAQRADRSTALSELEGRYIERGERLAAQGELADELRRELAARDSETTRLRAELGALHGRLAEQARLGELQSRRVQELHDDLSARDSQVEACRMEIAELERSSREQGARLAEVQGDAVSLRAELAARDAAISERDAQLDDLQGRYAELSARFDREAQRNEGLVAKISAHESLVSELRAARDAGQAEAERLRGDVFVLSSQLGELDHRHLKQTERLDDVIRRFKVERKKRRRLDSKLDRQLARAAAQQVSIDSLSAEKSAAEAKLAAIQSSRSWRLVSLAARFRRPLSVWNRWSQAKEADAPGNLPAINPGTSNAIPVATPAAGRDAAENASASVVDTKVHGVVSEPIPNRPIESPTPITKSEIASNSCLRSTDAEAKGECERVSKKMVKASERRRPQPPATSPYSISETELLERVRRYNGQKPTRRARVVVYTAIIGGYDPLIVPETIVDDWDYVVFSDQAMKGEHVFEVRRPEYWNADPTRIARQAKMHPHIHFPDYEISIWLDPNILVRGNHLRDSVRRFEKQGALFMSNPHPDRDCTYDELAKCLELNKDDPGLMKAQVERYRQEGLPAKYGMFETGILVRKHNDPQVRAFQTLWWQEISAGSRRDQLSVMYSLWKLGLEHHRLSDMKDIRDHSDNPYCLFTHKGKVSRKIPPYVAPSFMANDVSQVFADDLRSLRAKTVRRVKHRLELGLTERAVSELKRLAETDVAPDVQRAASWELALWHAARATATHAERAIEYLKVVVEDLDDTAGLRRAAIVEAECWQTLGKVNKARRALESVRARAPHVDLWLGLVNLEQEPTRRLELVSDAMRFSGLSGIHCSGDANVPLFDRIATSDVAAAAVPHGHNPKVTVIIPAYNSEATIGTALDSVLAQTWKNLEIIVVDDLSTDGTAAVVRERQLRDARVRIVTAPLNRGPYVARNLALELASGEFVTCNDADDWSHPERVEIQLREMLRRQDLVATVAGWARCTEDLTFSRRGNPGNYGQLNISSLMFRREPVIQALGCWDSVRFGADTEFFNRLKAAFGHNAVLEMPLAILSLGRLTSGSLTGDSAFGYPGYPMGARRAYRDAYLAHHGRSPATSYRGLAVRRPFPVPAPMWPIREATAGTRNFDVVIAADLRNAESTALVQADIPGLTGLGYRVALVNMPAYDFEPANARPNDQILSLVDGDRVQIVVYGEKVAGRTVVVVDPGILQDRQDYLPSIDGAEVHVVLPARADLAALSAVCVENIERYFGRRGVWHCAHSDQGRSLSNSALGHDLTIDKRPWKGLGNVIDLHGSERHPRRLQMHHGAGEQSGGVKLIDIKDIAAFSHRDPNGVAVIMPCIDVEKGRATAEVLLRRADMPCLVLVVNDSIRQGFIKTLNAAAAQLTVRYVVYLAEDAFPGRGWLRRAHQALEDSGKGLLGFNDGKWDGRIASFGMVRTSWVRQLYGGDVLNAEYRAHKADNELTVIARAADEYEYRPDCTLVEVDPRKDHRGSNQADDEIFAKRMLQGFGGIIARSDARALAKTYKVKWQERPLPVSARPIVSRVESGAAKPALG